MHGTQSPKPKEPPSNSRLHETGGDRNPLVIANFGTRNAIYYSMKTLLTGLLVGLATYGLLCYLWSIGGL